MTGKPGRKCGVCLHARRPEIDAALLSGRSHADLARQFGLSNDAISRHARRHISADAADRAPDAPSADPGAVDVVAAVADLQTRVMRLLKRAEIERDVRGALAAVREAAGLLTLLGKLQGIIGPDGARVAIQIGPSGSGRGTEVIRAKILGKLEAMSGGRAPLVIKGRAD